MEIQLTNCLETTIVSPQHSEHLNQFKWCKTPTGYVTSKIENKWWLLHRYTIGKLENKQIDDFIIDHKDNNKLNNTLENLRVTSRTVNARNRTKKLGATSEYYGVSFNKRDKKWVSKVIINGRYIDERYENEKHAAHARDLLVQEHSLEGCKLNNISDEFLQDFVRLIPRKKSLPVGITKKGDKYRLYVNHKWYGSFDNLDDAIAKNNSVRENIRLEKLAAILATPIKRNSAGDCIIEIFNKDKEKVAETIVDEEDYYDLIQYSWCCNGNYIIGKVGNKRGVALHRYVMKYDGKDYIDHIDRNPLNNKKDNLRLTTPKQNNLNKSSRNGSTSQFVGVHFDKTALKWISRITIDGKQKNLGRFDNEENAAMARDIATKEHYGDFGKLNFPECNLKGLILPQNKP